MRRNEVPRASGLLDVGDEHRIYWEEWGHPDGVCALFLHGGPGGGLAAGEYRHRFDLDRTRVIAFEQRGCGRSTPHASETSTSLTGNTTAALIGDIELLRQHLGVDTWIVHGVSWGSTLALAYAQSHPHRVDALVLVAVTTTSRAEVDWITEGVARFFPEAWDRLASFAEHADIGFVRGEGRLVEAYARLLNGSDPAIADAASHEWALWEDTHVGFGADNVARDPRWRDDRFRMAFTRLTTHYWSHDGFCPVPIFDRINRLAGIPAVLIHGRRDISSPPSTAWALHNAWPGSTLTIDGGDGHGGGSMFQRWSDAHRELVATLHHRDHAAKQASPGQ